ncbi:MAG: hypothetical protein ACLRWM_08540 [Streptococcus sp.]
MRFQIYFRNPFFFPLEIKCDITGAFTPSAIPLSIHLVMPEEKQFSALHAEPTFQHSSNDQVPSI